MHGVTFAVRQRQTSRGSQRCRFFGLESSVFATPPCRFVRRGGADGGMDTYSARQETGALYENLVNVPWIGDFEHHKDKYLLAIISQNLGDVNDLDI